MGKLILQFIIHYNLMFLILLLIIIFFRCLSAWKSREICYLRYNYLNLTVVINMKSRILFSEFYDNRFNIGIDVKTFQLTSD